MSRSPLVPTRVCVLRLLGCALLLLLAGSSTPRLLAANLAGSVPFGGPISRRDVVRRQYCERANARLASTFAPRFAGVAVLTVVFGILGWCGDRPRFSAAGSWSIAGLGACFLLSGLTGLIWFGTLLLPVVAGCLGILSVFRAHKSGRFEGDVLIVPIALGLVLTLWEFTQAWWQVYGD